METIEQLKEKVTQLEAQIVELQRELESFYFVNEELTRAVNECTCE